MASAGVAVVSRILWVSNAPWSPSGYGEQTALFLERAKAAGHQLAVATNYGLQSKRDLWNDIVCYPAETDWVTGIPLYAQEHDADLVVVLYDAWKLNPEGWSAGRRAAVWAPIDHDPIPPLVAAALAQKDVTPIAMSRFGEEQMREANLDPLYVPHGIDTALFSPRPELKDETRDQLGIPLDAFLVGMVAANKSHPQVSRKGFPQAFTAFSRFAAEHEDAWLYVHSQWRNGSGHDLNALADATGCPPSRLRYVPEEAWRLGIPRELVAKIMGAFDVLLSPSMGEGFGIPIIEAQASGVPVIASDHSAMSELTQAGWLVPGDPWWDEPQRSWFIAPHIPSIQAALEAAYEERNNQALRESAVAFARQYDADHVFYTYWKPALEKLTAQKVVGPLQPNRAMRRAAKKEKAAA